MRGNRPVFSGGAIRIWQSPNPRPKMLFRSINKSTPALLAKRMNEASRNSLREYLVASVKSLCGHDPQGKLTGVQRPAGESLLT